MWLPVLLFSLVLASPLAAAEHRVAPGTGSLAAAIAEAAPGDVLMLTDGAIWDLSLSIGRLSSPARAALSSMARAPVA